MLCKNSWCNGETFAPQYIGERFKFFFMAIDSYLLHSRLGNLHD